MKFIQNVFGKGKNKDCCEVKITEVKKPNDNCCSVSIQEVKGDGKQK